MSGALAALLQLIRRWPYSAACVLTTVLSGAFAALLWFGEIPAKQASDRVNTREHEDTETKLAVRKRLEQELTEARAKRLKIEANLVDEANLAENLVYFYTIEEQTKARLPELHQVSSPTSDKVTYYRRVPYGLRVAGTYDQVAAYLIALETGKRLSKITSFNLARTDPAGRTVALDLNVELLGKK